MTATREATRAAVAAWVKRWARAARVPHSAALELKAILDAGPCDSPEESRERYESVISKPEGA